MRVPMEGDHERDRYACTASCRRIAGADDRPGAPQRAHRAPRAAARIARQDLAADAVVLAHVGTARHRSAGAPVDARRDARGGAWLPRMHELAPLSALARW